MPGDRPTHFVKAKINERWLTLASVWPIKGENKGYSLQFATVPVAWDGRCILVPRTDDDKTSE